MFIHRLLWKVNGSLNDAAALMKDFHERFAPPHPVRILTSWLYPSDGLAEEHEFKSLAEYEEFWKERNTWFDTGGAAAWLSENKERMGEVFGPDAFASQELWEVR